MCFFTYVFLHRCVSLHMCFFTDVCLYIYVSLHMCFCTSVFLYICVSVHMVDRRSNIIPAYHPPFISSRLPPPSSLISCPSHFFPLPLLSSCPALCSPALLSSPVQRHTHLAQHISQFIARPAFASLIAAEQGLLEGRASDRCATCLSA